MCVCACDSHMLSGRHVEMEVQFGMFDVSGSVVSQGEGEGVVHSDVIVSDIKYDMEELHTYQQKKETEKKGERIMNSIRKVSNKRQKHGGIKNNISDPTGLEETSDTDSEISKTGVLLLHDDRPNEILHEFINKKDVKIQPHVTEVDL